MDQKDLEYIVSMVTQQVMAAMAQSSACCSAQTEGHSKVLLIGKATASVPAELCQDCVCLDLEDYRAHKNILRYDRIVITGLSVTQLADIALGRIGDDATCAIIHALLSGVDTVMLESALTFRKYAGKGSTALYNLLESYVRTIQVFGVKMANQKVKPEVVEAKPPKFAAPPVQVPKGTAVPNASRLVTETEALALVKEGNPVHLPAGAIITPSARDVFSQAGVTLMRDR